MNEAAPQSLIPRHTVYRDFLDPQERAELLAWAMENEAKFEPSSVRNMSKDRRKSLRVRDFGPMEDVFRQRVLELVPALTSELGVPPFEPSEITTELVAHNDGAFFKRHIDRFYGDKEGKNNRVLSVVYYFHNEPKAFSGGELRLYAIAAQEGERGFVDILPEQNTLLVFPSVASHEVLPVSCPSGRFADSRFAVNVWVNRSPKN